MLRFDRLFVLMNKQGIRQTDIRKLGIHPRTIQKLRRGELIRSDVINNLCAMLNCQPGDIMDYVADDNTNATQEDSTRGDSV